MKKTVLRWGVAFCCVFILKAGVLFAAGTVKEQPPLRRILSVQKRGVINLLTAPGEWGHVFGPEKKNHPKAWPVTYVPRALTYMFYRMGSGANDVFVLPFFVNATKDATPITRRFDMPDYYWEKD